MLCCELQALGLLRKKSVDRSNRGLFPVILKLKVTSGITYLYCPILDEEPEVQREKETFLTLL